MILAFIYLSNAKQCLLLLINPDDQQFIAQVCQKHGWTAPLVYDGEEEDWLW
jgi:hypothetical protein